jgi:hypothetical protein
MWNEFPKIKFYNNHIILKKFKLKIYILENFQYTSQIIFSLMIFIFSFWYYFDIFLNPHFSFFCVVEIELSFRKSITGPQSF